MSDQREEKKKKAGVEVDVKVLSWQQKKIIADEEEEVIGKEVEELITWTSLIEAMDERELKEYVLNRPGNLQSVKIGKGASSQKVQRNGKPKCSDSTGLMATIWKFHKEEDEETPSKFTV